MKLVLTSVNDVGYIQWVGEELDTLKGSERNWIPPELMHQCGVFRRLIEINKDLCETL